MNSVISYPQPGIMDLENKVKQWIKDRFKNPFGNAIYKADPICDDDDTPDWVIQECNRERGGVIAVGVIRQGFDLGTTDEEIVAFLEDADNWDTQMVASPQNMWVIRPTRGSKAPGTPTEEAGWGLASVSRTGDENEVAFEAQGIMSNYPFVKAVNKRAIYGFVYVTAGGSQADGYNARYVPNVSVYMSEVLDQDTKSEARWAGSAKWTSDGTPALPFVAPSAIFS